jgi:hypothetical protein
MNNITTIMHKETKTLDIHGSHQCRATSTNSSYSLLSYVNIITCTEPQDPLHIGQEICPHLTRSSFLELDYSTKLSYSPYTSLLQSLALSSASSQHMACTKHSQLFALSSLAILNTHMSLLLRHLYLYLYITKGPKTWVNPRADIPYPLYKP